MTRYILLIAMLLPMSCGTSGSSDEAQPELLRVIHAATGFSSIEVSVFQESAGSSSSSTTARAEKEDATSVTESYSHVTDYFAIPEGDIKVRIRELNSVLPALELTPTIDAGAIQTLLLTESSSAIVGTFVTDDALDTNDGEFRIRVLNGVGSAVDGYIGFPSAEFGDASTLASAVTSATASTYLGIEEGSYVVYITKAGKTAVVAETQTTSFKPGYRYSIVVFEAPDGGEPYSVQVLRDR